MNPPTPTHQTKTNKGGFITLKVDDFIITIHPSELEIKDQYIDQIPMPDEIETLSKRVYDVTLYAEFVGHATVRAYDLYEALERAKDVLEPKDYELNDYIHDEVEIIDHIQIDPETEEEFDYYTYLFREYGYGIFKLKGWQTALLGSKNQTTLKQYQEDKP